MTLVQKLNYNSFLDVRSGIEFKQMEDKRIQQFAAVADVPDDQMHFFEGHSGFKVIPDAEYALMMGVKPSALAPVTAPLHDAPLSPEEAATKATFEAALAKLEADAKVEADANARQKQVAFERAGVIAPLVDAAAAKQTADAKAAKVAPAAAADVAKDPLADAPVPPPSA